MEEYYRLENDWSQIGVEMALAVAGLTTFTVEHSGYLRDCKQRLRNRRTVAEDIQQLEVEIKDMEKELGILQDEVDRCKLEKEDNDKDFKAEKHLEANSKAFGQPLRAFVDVVLKKHGIDRAAQHGGKLEGNQCRKLMAVLDAICTEILNHVLQVDGSSRVVGTDEDLREVVELHWQLLVALDRLFSGLRTV